MLCGSLASMLYGRGYPQTRLHGRLGVVFDSFGGRPGCLIHTTRTSPSHRQLPSECLYLRTFLPHFWAGISYMYTCMHASTRLIASHHTLKVHDVTAKHCALIDQRHAPVKTPILFMYRPKNEHGLSYSDQLPPCILYIVRQ